MPCTSNREGELRLDGDQGPHAAVRDRRLDVFAVPSGILLLGGGADDGASDATTGPGGAATTLTGR